MTRRNWIHVGFVLLVAALAMFIIRLHNAGGAAANADSIESGRKLVEAWCRTCHVTGARGGGAPGAAPDFVAVASMPSTTALSLKVFLRTSHPNMPNLILTPEQTEDIVSYILSLKRN